MKSWVRYRHFMVLELTLAPVFASAGFLLNRYAGWPAWLAVASSALALTVTVAVLISTGKLATHRMVGVAIAAVAPLLSLGAALSAAFPSCRCCALIVVLGLYGASLYAAYRSWPKWAMKPSVFTAATVAGWAMFLFLVRFCPVLMERAVFVAEILFIIVSGDARW